MAEVKWECCVVFLVVFSGLHAFLSSHWQSTQNKQTLSYSVCVCAPITAWETDQISSIQESRSKQVRKEQKGGKSTYCEKERQRQTESVRLSIQQAPCKEKRYSSQAIYSAHWFPSVVLCDACETWIACSRSKADKKRANLNPVSQANWEKIVHLELSLNSCNWFMEAIEGNSCMNSLQRNLISYKYNLQIVRNVVWLNIIESNLLTIESCQSKFDYWTSIFRIFHRTNTLKCKVYTLRSPERFSMTCSSSTRS